MLGEFLAEAARRRRIAGVWDCCTFPAEWAMRNGHPDPMAKWRGYESETEAEHLIAEAGGLDVLFAEGLAGLEATDLRAGDIGVIGVGAEQAGAVFTGKRWAIVLDRGLGFTSIEPEHVLRVWRP